MALLDDSQIAERLGGLPEWRREGDAIVRRVDCGNFVGSVELVRKLVEPAEEMNHHPDLEISWSEVTIRLSTHSEGGLTEADFELAKRIEALA